MSELCEVVIEDQAAAWNRLYADVEAYVRSLRQCSFFLDDR